MSVRIFEDIEEAISREVRRISTHQQKTKDKTVLKETYDPFTGEIIQIPLEANYYDSSADASKVEYPHFFVRLMKSREDRFSGREIPLYGRWIRENVKFSPKAFEIVTNGGDGLINAVGNTLNTGILGIAKVQAGYLLRILTGNNTGTYLVDQVIKDSMGNHSIVVSNTLLQNLPEFGFDLAERKITFLEGVDLSAVKVNDVFTDEDLVTYNILSVDVNTGTIEIDGAGVPTFGPLVTISRSTDVFDQTDLQIIRFLVLDPSKPVQAISPCGDVEDKNSKSLMINPPVPLDAYYRIRIDSKTRENHRDILNRIWEEFNPPRTALPVIRRTELSADALLQEDIPAGGSDTLTLLESDVQDIKVGDKVFLSDDLFPSKKTDGDGFERAFESTVIAKPSATEVQLADIVPDTFTTSRCTKVITNAVFELYMFHFQDHVTKDNEGAQYWVHEFTFWVQFWVDRQGLGKEESAITQILQSAEENDGDGDDSNNFVYFDEC